MRSTWIIIALGIVLLIGSFWYHSRQAELFRGRIDELEVTRDSLQARVILWEAIAKDSRQKVEASQERMRELLLEQERIESTLEAQMSNPSPNGNKIRNASRDSLRALWNSRIGTE